jgi:hypothetical protein
MIEIKGGTDSGSNGEFWVLFHSEYKAYLREVKKVIMDIFGVLLFG